MHMHIFWQYSTFMEAMQDGTIEITAEDWPTFLYVEDTVYDPDNHEKNLLHGLVVLYVCHFFKNKLYYQAQSWFPTGFLTHIHQQHLCSRWLSKSYQTLKGGNLFSYSGNTSTNYLYLCPCKSFIFLFSHLDDILLLP